MPVNCRHRFDEAVSGIGSRSPVSWNSQASNELRVRIGLLASRTRLSRRESRYVISYRVTSNSHRVRSYGEMHVNGPRTIIGLAAAAALVLTGCSGVNNVLGGLGGGKGNARLVVASLTTPQTNISLTADGGTINSGLSASTPIGTYAQVGAGQETFAINTGTGTGNLVSSINVSVASSTNYSIVLEGEPGAPDYLAFGFQDTNALNNAATVRFKVNNAAPNLTSAVDVYVWLSTNAIPSTPTVA